MLILSKMKKLTNEAVDLETKARKIRRDILDLSLDYNDGHITSSFSVVEILVVLYTHFYREEDKIILSKGHGCLSLYAILRDKGFNPRVSGHPDIQLDEGVCCTTGSLGHGLPIGVGMAFAKKIQGKKGHVFVIIGDGECQEGTVWESLNLARKFRLDNLTIVVDHNKLQALDTIKKIIDETELKSKFVAFGCYSFEVDGHNVGSLVKAFDTNKIRTGFPRAIIANTTKGKGISFMENKPEWHNRMLTGELLKKAHRELE